MDLNTDDPNNSGKTAQVQLCEETITKGKQEAKTFPPAVEACAQHCSRNKCCGKNPNICSQSNPNRENDVYSLGTKCAIMHCKYVIPRKNVTTFESKSLAVLIYINIERN